jgi:hypothetical protein
MQLLFTGTNTWTQRRLTTRCWLDMPTCASMTPWHILSQTTILIRLLAPHLGTTSSISDHPPPLASRWHCRVVPLYRSSEHDHPSPCERRHTRHLHLVVPLTDDRSPRGASTGRLLGASATSNLHPRSDTNCWDSPTDQSYEAKQTHAETETTFIVKRACRTL